MNIPQDIIGLICRYCNEERKIYKKCFRVEYKHTGRLCGNIFLHINFDHVDKESGKKLFDIKQILTLEVKFPAIYFCRGSDERIKLNNLAKRSYERAAFRFEFGTIGRNGLEFSFSIYVDDMRKIVNDFFYNYDRCIFTEGQFRQICNNINVNSELSIDYNTRSYKDKYSYKMNTERKYRIEDDAAYNWKAIIKCHTCLRLNDNLEYTFHINAANGEKIKLPLSVDMKEYYVEDPEGGLEMLLMRNMDFLEVHTEEINNICYEDMEQ